MGVLAGPLGAEEDTVFQRCQIRKQKEQLEANIGKNLQGLRRDTEENFVGRKEKVALLWKQSVKILSISNHKKAKPTQSDFRNKKSTLTQTIGKSTKSLVLDQFLSSHGV